jgi:hypothetical protein
VYEAPGLDRGPQSCARTVVVDGDRLTALHAVKLNSESVKQNKHFSFDGQFPHFAHTLTSGHPGKHTLCAYLYVYKRPPPTKPEPTKARTGARFTNRAQSGNCPTLIVTTLGG